MTEDLVAANRILVNEGVLDAYGHVSLRHPANPARYLMGRNLAPALVTAADIVEYDLDSEPVGAPANFAHFFERFIHGEIYRARPDVNAVVHSHSPAVIPFSVSERPMRPLYHMSSFLYPGVPVFEIRETGGMTDMLIGSRELGAALAKTLGDKNVALMRGHGNVVVANTLPHGGVPRGLYRGERAPADASDRARRRNQLPRSRGGRKGDAGSGKHSPARLGRLEANGAQGRRALEPLNSRGNSRDSARRRDNCRSSCGANARPETSRASPPLFPPGWR